MRGLERTEVASEKRSPVFVPGCQTYTQPALCSVVIPRWWKKTPYSTLRIAPGVLMVPLHVVTVLCEGRQQAQTLGCAIAIEPGSL